MKLKNLFSLIVGTLLAMLAISGMASARSSDPTLLRDGPVASGQDVPALALTYARIITNNVPVYRHPSEAAMDVSPIRSLGAGYLWVSLADSRPVSHDGLAWYLINRDEYVRADHLAVYRPSAFQGVTLPAPPDKAFGWMVMSARASSTPGAAPAKDAPWLSRYMPITIFEEKQVGHWMWYRVGENQWIEQRSVGIVKPSTRPEGVGPNDKWIDISNSRFDWALTAAGIWAMIEASPSCCTRPRRFADGRASHAVSRRLDWPHPG